MENTITPFKITCSIRSLSHRLNKEAFSLLMPGEIDIFVSDVKEKTFLLSIINQSAGSKTLEQFSVVAHLCFSNFLMALNIATLGHFTWNFGTFVSQFYQCIVPENERRTKIIALQRIKENENDIRDITKQQIRNTKLLFIALAEERESNVKKEYIKGILHLSLDFFDIDFHREAFGNFYRSFENFATGRILKVKNLTNEKKQLQEAIIKCGFPNKLAEEFLPLYILRSEQVMHAQKKQVNIKIDDALKMKVILDAILHKVYQPIWEKRMDDLREKINHK